MSAAHDAGGEGDSQPSPSKETVSASLSRAAASVFFPMLLLLFPLLPLLPLLLLLLLLVLLLVLLHVKGAAAAVAAAFVAAVLWV